MKIVASDQDRFLQSAPASVSAVLFYGPDQGLVRERAGELVARVAGDAADPFRVAELSATQLKDDPALLADEAAALSLSGGRRVLRLRETADGHAPALAELLAGPGPASFLVLEAGDLAKRSPLRKVFEAARNAAAIACFLDDAKALGRVVVEALSSHGLAVEPEALAYLISHMGGDRGVTRQELEKLALYMGASGPDTGVRRVAIEDVLAVIADSSALSLEDLIFALGDGDRAAIDRGFARALLEGNEEITILHAAARHLMRLHLVSAAPDPQFALKTLRPPVFYKLEKRFLAQAPAWSADRVGEALDRLNRAEIDIKTGAQPKAAVAERALLEIGGLARGRRAKTPPRALRETGVESPDHVVQLLQRGIADDDAPARGPMRDLDRESEEPRQIALQRARVAVLVHGRDCLPAPGHAAARGERLGLTHREAQGHDLLCERQGIAGVQQGPGMARGQFSDHQHRLHAVGQPQQTQRIGDMGAALAHMLGQILLGEAELLDQPVIAFRLLEGGEIVALQIFHQRQLQHLAIGEIAHDDGNVVQLGELGCPPAPLAGDDLMDIGLAGVAAHQNRLQYAVGADRFRQRLEFLGIEMAARLQRAGLELADGKLALAAGRCGRGAQSFTQQRREAATQSASSVRRHALTPAGCSRRNTSPAR